jgi:RHS repeat-associated protein
VELRDFPAFADSGSWINETLTYNSLLQVTNMNLGSLMNMQYNYSATQNNGRITSSNDYVTVEDANVSYTYDALNRLTGASAGSKWGEAYSYDGFGNLTDKSVTQVPAPSLGVSYDANNHQVGMAYDANGNQLWDSGQHATAYGWNMENKLVTQTSQGWPGAETWYSYDAFGRRVMKDVNPNPNGYPGFTGGTWEFYFYGITGQKLVTRMCGYSTDGNQTPGCSPSNDQHNVYFGSKLIEANWALVVTDRLGNVRARSGGNGYTQMSYFPYGEERTVTPDGVDKFGTYFRDGPGQDYAQQRYYNNETGRFWSVDPGGMATADPSTPTSLNRYAYVNGDPVNYGDPSGRIVVYAGGGLILNCGGDASSIYDGSCTGTDGGWGGGDGGGGGNLCSAYQDMFLGMPGPPGCVDPPPPSFPPLQCAFAANGFASDPPGFGYVRGPQKFSIPVSFTFVASGGSGSYSWSDTQTIYLSGSVAYSNGAVYNYNPPESRTESLDILQQSGSTVAFWDAPGLPLMDPNRGRNVHVMAAVLLWNASLTAYVTDTVTQQTVQCDAPVMWQAFLLWTTVRGRPVVSGGANLLTLER